MCSIKCTEAKSVTINSVIDKFASKNSQQMTNVEPDVVDINVLLCFFYACYLKVHLTV